MAGGTLAARRMSGTVTNGILVGATIWLVGCAPVPPTPPPPTGPGDSGITGKFIGSTRCQVCHTKIHDDWSATLHAGALATLENVGQDQNPTCLPCHTVGYGEDGGFVDRLTTNDLANVGCEACHGASRAHVENVTDVSLRPPVPLASETCGRCHTTSRHPTFDQWMQSRHARVTPFLATRFQEGRSLNSCGPCHSGDFFYRAIVLGEDVADDALAGVSPDAMNAVECAVCHAPHTRTGNAAMPDPGRDFQLRFREVASSPPTDTIAAVQDTTRFNLCGQCHHSRGNTWESTREPHGSVQVNMFQGEMPVPDGTEPLVLGRVSVHSFAMTQCATCHMFRQDFHSEEAPALSGHGLEVSFSSCVNTGCHPSTAQAMAARTTVQGEMQARLDDIAARLGDPSTWEYSSNGGPDAAGQDQIPDEIKKVRFLYHYVLSDGSLGPHNPAYTRDILVTASDILAGLGQ
jgi:hypothetical protein